jgi:hypothetical protein
VRHIERENAEQKWLHTKKKKQKKTKHKYKPSNIFCKKLAFAR